MKNLHRLEYKDYELGLYLPGDDAADSTGTAAEPKELSVRKEEKKDSYLMNAEMDENGEMVATEKLDPTTITARFRNKAEHFGYVDLEFDIVVPGEIIMDENRVNIQPILFVLSDTLLLKNIYITGKEFRKKQYKGEELYEKFISKIETDTTNFLERKQFEKFLERYIPEVYALKDSDEELTEQEFKSFFGVDCMEAYKHFLNKHKIKLNNKRISLKTEKREQYCPFEIGGENVLFDTVWFAGQDFTYRYEYSIKTRPKMKKIDVIVGADIVNCVNDFYIDCENSQPLSFYVSSISALTRDTQRRFRNGTIDEKYAEGLQALKDMDYEKAGQILRKYKDYNAALAMLAIDNNYTAEDILINLPESADTDYLLAIVYKRMGDEDKAVSLYLKSCKLDGKFIHRGNLDAEISSLIKKHNLSEILQSDDFATEY